MSFQGLSAPAISVLSWYIVAAGLEALGLIVIFIERYNAFLAVKGRRPQKHGWSYVRMAGGVFIVLGVLGLAMASVKFHAIPETQGASTGGLQ